ncbi:hypothetical protein BKA65DRAFT_602701 [Rhexocercosporidium sp. MPI-PUGE-AT-0058]|nr:hypothetical protein BKA65DRAFT_602701 [Rhexocercosporidium sp. MPI-PUGE-AT-0058]
MATPWPQHAIYLSDYLKETLIYIDSAKDQPVPKPLIKTIIAAISVFIAKFQNTSDIAILSQETNQAVKEAAETRRTTTELLQETNDIAKATNDIVKAIQSTPSPKASYTSVLSSNAAPLSKPITISTKTSLFIQAQPIKQSKNKYIKRIRINRIKRGTNIRLSTYRILAHGIKTNLINIKKFDEIKAELLHDNRPFILNVDIKYIK